MEKKRRLLVVTAAGVMLVLLGAAVLPVWAQIIVQPGFPNPGIPQPVPKPRPGVSPASQLAALQLIEDEDYRKYISVARSCINNELWNDAVTALQAILDKKEDFYVRVVDRNARNEMVERWTSVKYEANKLLGLMPKDGLRTYELRYGGKARAMLNEAKRTGDLEMLAEVAQRFLNTSAGPEANDLLATYFLDRGQFFMAALRYERLLSLPEDRFKTQDLTLLKAALAYRRAGDDKNYKSTWQKLFGRLAGPGGMKLGDRFVPLADLQKLLQNAPQPLAARPHDWPLIRGNSTATAQAGGSAPLLDEVVWHRPLVMDKNEITEEVDPGNNAKTWLDNAINASRSQGTPIMPGAFPIAVDGKLIYRNTSRIMAVALHKTVEDGFTIKPGEILWQSAGFESSLAQALESTRLNSTLLAWLNRWQQLQHLNVVYENSMTGTLSSDLHRVYAVDDLAIPVPPDQVRLLMNIRIGGAGNISQTVRDRIYNNILYAYDIKTGKIAWRRGTTIDRNKVDPDFEDSLFLGPPLAVGGKLFVLNERKNGELRLVALDPTKGGQIIGAPQVLGSIQRSSSMAYDANRRTRAVHMAYGEGILICPTNAGQILGVDLMSRTLAWAYPYREKGSPTGNPGIGIPGNPSVSPLPPPGSVWKFAPPVIAKGKVVFTAPDAQSLHCLNLRDGTRAWTYPKKASDLYLAGVWNDKVVVVGKNSCKALNLKDGTRAWTVATGELPSGQGVASDDIYYLPLQNGEIVAVDIKRGVIKAHNRPQSEKAPVPGNLIFYEGAVLSQTPKKIIAYPQLVAKLDTVRASVKKNPGNLLQRTLLGELLLADGKVQLAVEELRKVRSADPKDANLRQRVRQRLYEALTDLLQIDFNVASTKYLDEYRELIKVPSDSTEEQRRKGQFLRILGKGREQQGNLVAAYDAYREFRGIELYQKEGVPDVDDPQQKVPMEVWLRNRLSAMFLNARAEDKKPLENRIEEDWQRIQKSKNPTEIRGFVSMFDTTFPKGRDARLYLARAVVDKGAVGSYLEAELYLLELQSGKFGDRTQRGRALATLAELELRRGTGRSGRAAAQYCRILKEHFGDVKLLDGSTGRQLYNKFAADPRLRAYFAKARASWGDSMMKTHVVPITNINTDLFGFALQPRGEITPATENIRLILDTSNLNNPRVKLLDLNTNQLRWTASLSFPAENIQLMSYYSSIMRRAQSNSSYYPNASFRYFHVKGRLAVVQVASEVYAIDLSKGKLVWQRSLIKMADFTKQQFRVNGLTVGANGALHLMLYSSTLRRNQTVRLGEIGAVHASYVALLRGNRLIVVQPLDGKKVMWQKTETPENAFVFGDERTIFLAPPAGATQALRAGDGKRMNVKDFSLIFQNKLRIRGRQVLASQIDGANRVVRLFDPAAGKDVWSRKFASDSIVMQTPHRDIVGVVERNGDVYVMNVADGKDQMKGNVLQGKFNRITKADLANLQNPLLLADADRYYVALNQPLDGARISGGVLASNFNNGIECRTINGWFCAFHRKAGTAAFGDTKVQWKAGDLAWYSSRPVLNQLVLVEQFDRIPVVLFSVRYTMTGRNPDGSVRRGGISLTQSIDRRTGKWVHDPRKAQPNNNNPRFSGFEIDAKKGEINMISFGGVLQHFVNDGRPRTKGRPDTGSIGLQTSGLVPNPGGIRPPIRRNPIVFPGGGAVLPGGGGIIPPGRIINPRVPIPNRRR